MAINQNHLFEELNGLKCAIVEKNVAPPRVDFLRRLLEDNGLTVVVVPSPPPKAPPVAASAPAASSSPAGSPAPADSTAVAPAPETFTVGVTDVQFNPINAVFGRLLKTSGGHTVTLAYWRQQENEPDNEKPYFEGR
jgi:hypothetical protein